MAAFTHNQQKDARMPHRPRPALLHSTTGSTFELGRALGGGGMGHVYLAQQHRESESGQLVALKLLRLNAPEPARRLFYHEGTLLPRLQNPHIVRHVESGRGAVAGIGAVDYLALGYIAGSTTEDMLKQRQSPLPPAIVLGIVAQLTTALAYLHQRGVVHCDLKPGNIMLEHATPRAVLIDFGIARAPDFLGQPVAVGTPQYMAPEQADPRSECDGRADIYALGVVIYELLTGWRLFPRRTTTDIRRGHLVSITHAELAGKVALPLAQVIARCLQHNPQERYGTVGELLEDMQRALVEEDG